MGKSHRRRAPGPRVHPAMECQAPAPYNSHSPTSRCPQDQLAGDSCTTSPRPQGTVPRPERAVTSPRPHRKSAAEPGSAGKDGRLKAWAPVPPAELPPPAHRDRAPPEQKPGCLTCLLLRRGRKHIYSINGGSTFIINLAWRVGFSARCCEPHHLGPSHLRATIQDPPASPLCHSFFCLV